MKSATSFYTEQEMLLERRFVEQGYVQASVEDKESLDRIRELVVGLAAEQMDTVDIANHAGFLNHFHDTLSNTHSNTHSKDSLNKTRLDIIKGMNNKDWLRPAYFALAKHMLESIVGNELAMQMRVNLSIQLPGDESSLLPIHADVWSGDSPFEVVLWIPLVDCYASKSMYLLPPAHSAKLNNEFGQFSDKSSDAIFKHVEKDLLWLNVPYGEYILFNQNLPHGNVVNRENETRWSMNCRFKSVFSPYADKKLGEFFEPITLRPATRIGMSFQLPRDMR